MDNILGNDIGRCSLCPEDGSDRCSWFFTLFDLQVFMDEIKGIHLLSLVLMKTFDLDIENGVRVNGDALGLFQIVSQRCLFLGLDV